MKIGIQRDDSFKIDVAKCVQLLNSICKAIQFSELIMYSVSPHSTKYINYNKESSRLSKLGKSHHLDFTIYVTSRSYKDNYYFYSSDSDIIMSMAHWEHYTSLPVENGVLFFIAQCIEDRIYGGLNHDKSIGCISDYLWKKTDVDKCMKMGFICSSCHDILQKAITKSPKKKGLYIDLIHILDVIANTSRWNKNVLCALENKELSYLTPEGFENLVADYYRGLNAKVTQNVNIAGFQIDAFVTESTPSGEPLRSIIECKFYQDKIGNRIVNDFARIVATIKEAGEADRGIIVAFSGFTQDAHLAAKHTNIRLIHYKDIAEQVKLHEIIPPTTKDKKETLKTETVSHSQKSSSKNVFVIMPFSSELDDLFYYGIHGAIRQAKASCTRVDQLHFTGGILQEIYENIKNAQLIIAEVSQQNSNVFYELGFAHALNKPVILLTKDISGTPFDISGFNHIIYKNITDLEQKLIARLNALL